VPLNTAREVSNYRAVMQIWLHCFC